MSYTRIIEDGCYIFPEVNKAGIRVMIFPNEELDFIPDTILDVILSKMSEKELQDRKLHGQYIRKLLADNQLQEASNNKDFFEWRKDNV